MAKIGLECTKDGLEHAERVAASLEITSANGIELGNADTDDNFDAIAIGNGATSSDSGAVSIGKSSEANDNSSIAIGREAKAGGRNSIAIGTTVDAAGANSIAIGADALNDNAVVIGSTGNATLCGVQVVNNGKIPYASLQNTSLPTGSGGEFVQRNLQSLATYLFGKDLKSVSFSGDPLNFGSVRFNFNDNSFYISDIKAISVLPTGSGGSDETYDLQQLAAYLYSKDIIGVRIGTEPGNLGKLVLQKQNGTQIVSDIDLKPMLPTGSDGANVRYSLQDLATYLYTQLGTKANSAEVFPQSPTGYQSDLNLGVCNTVVLDNFEEIPTFDEFAQTCIDCISTKMIVYTTELFIKTNAESNPQQLHIGIFSTVEAVIPETGDGYLLFVQGTVDMGDTTYCGNVMIQENANHEFVISHGGDYDNGTFDYVAKQSDITAAVAGKQNILTFDSAPTQSSTNPVTSGGIYTAIDNAVGSIETALQGLISGGGVV